MPWDSIGSVNTGQIPDDESWIRFCLGLALRYVRHTCGNPPPGCALEIMTDEDGSHSLGVWADFAPPQESVRKCEDTFFILNWAADWDQLQEHFEKVPFRGDEEDRDERGLKEAL